MKLQQGQIVEAEVTRCADFGAFVRFGELEALLHVVDLSWYYSSKKIEEFFKVGDTIQVMILNFDPEFKRISVGYKQLSPCPWDELPEYVDLGYNCKGKVLNVADYGATVEILPGIIGLLPRFNIKTALNVDAELDVCVEYLDKKDRRIGFKENL